MARVFKTKEIRARGFYDSFISEWRALQVAFSSLYSSRHHKQGDK